MNAKYLIRIVMCGLCLLSVKVNAEGDADPQSNLLAGIATRFEGGSAGWQVFLLPHYPAVRLEPDYVREQAGEGEFSLRIPPGAGVNSMPIPPARGKGLRTLSFLVRAGQDTEIVVRQGYGIGRLTDVRVPATREWTRVHATFTAPENNEAPYYFIENRPVPGRNTDVFIDALHLSSGLNREYFEPEMELGLAVQAPGKVRADLRLAEGIETPGAWTWTLEEVAMDSTVLAHGAVQWEAEGARHFSAIIGHPQEHGLFRLVLLREVDKSIEPMQELLIANAPFTGLPELRDGGTQVAVGIHAHHNWSRESNPDGFTDYHPDWEGFLRGLRVMGVEWMRFHGGRENPTVLASALREGPGKDYLLMNEHLKPYTNAGFRLVAVLDVSFGELFRRKPWYPARVTHGEWGSHALPEDMTIWTDFVRAMATAYADVFDVWEIVNEPNGTMTAEDYMPLLKTAYTILKEVVPDKPVLGIGATADYQSSLGGFIEKCFTLGAADFMDVLSFYPYVGNDTPEASLQLMIHTAEIREKSGADKGLWNTEVGWTSVPTYISHHARSPVVRDGGMGAVGLPSVLSAAYTARNILHTTRTGVSHYFIWSGMNPQFAWQAKGIFGPVFEYDGTLAPLYFTLGTIQRVLQQATFREAIPLRDGGLWVYLYDFPDQRVLAAVWTNERVESSDLRSGALSLPPARAWDGMGRPLEPSPQTLLATPLPGYFVWDAAETGDIADRIRTLTWEKRPRFQMRVGPALDGSPRFEIRASNPLSTSVPSLWVQDGAPPRYQDIAAGSDIRLASGRNGTPQTPATLDGTIKIGATNLTRIQQRNRFHSLTITPQADSEEQALHITDAASITFGQLPGGFLEANPLRIGLRATPEGLHIAFDVPKPSQTFLQTEVGAAQINMDSVEVFLRTRPDEVNWTGGGYQRGDIKFNLAQDHRDPQKKALHVDQGADAIHPEQIEFAFAARRDSPGYTGTVFLPWSALPMLQAVPPATLGFDLSFNLADAAGRRQAQITWSGPGFNWLDPGGFGVLRILPAAAPAEPGE